MVIVGKWKPQAEVEKEKAVVVGGSWCSYSGITMAFAKWHCEVIMATWQWHYSGISD